MYEYVWRGARNSMEDKNFPFIPRKIYLVKKGSQSGRDIFVLMSDRTNHNCWSNGK